MKWNVQTHLNFVCWTRLTHHPNAKSSTVAGKRKFVGGGVGGGTRGGGSKRPALKFPNLPLNLFLPFNFAHFKDIKNLVSFFQPCYCSAYVHVTCLQKWLQVSKTHTCEVCNFQFKAERRMKPISQVIYTVYRGCIGFHLCFECSTLMLSLDRKYKSKPQECSSILFGCSHKTILDTYVTAKKSFQTLSRHINDKPWSEKHLSPWKPDDLSIDLPAFIPKIVCQLAVNMPVNVDNTLWDQRVSVNVNLPVSQIENQRIKQLMRRSWSGDDTEHGRRFFSLWQALWSYTIYF